jgi:hypothetical protein
VVLLAPAVSGLLGVLLGVGATSGITYLGDRNHRSADKRAAIRIVALEVRTDQLALLDFLRYGRHPTRPRLTMAAWREERGTLARYLPPSGWRAVANFYLKLQAAEPRLTSQRCLPPRRRDDVARLPLDQGNYAVTELKAYKPINMPTVYERACPRAKRMG